MNHPEDAHELIGTAILTALQESKHVYIGVNCNIPTIPHPTFCRDLASYFCFSQHHSSEIATSGRLSAVASNNNFAAATTSKPKEDKLWGGRFKASVTDTVVQFSESISFDKAICKHDISGSRAHAAMLAHQDSILRGFDEIERRIEAGEFAWRVDREDVHLNIEAALTDLIGDPTNKLHTTKSRNNQVMTDLRLWCREAIDKIVIRINQLQVSLVNLDIKNEGLIVPGYTYLKRAMPGQDGFTATSSAVVYRAA